MQFKEWLADYEEGLLGNLVALGGMALAGGKGDPASAPQKAGASAPPAVVQTAVNEPLKVHGVEVYVTLEKARQLKKMALQAIKNMETFETSIMPMLQDNKGGFKRLWQPGKAVGPGNFARADLQMPFSQTQVDTVLNHYKDQLRLFASYTARQISNGFSWGTDRDVQDRLNRQIQHLEKNVLIPWSTLQVNPPDFNLIHPNSLPDQLGRPGLPDDRSEEEKRSDNRLAKWAPWVKALSSLEYFDWENKKGPTGIDAVLFSIPQGKRGKR